MQHDNDHVLTGWKNWIKMKAKYQPCYCKNSKRFLSFGKIQA